MNVASYRYPAVVVLLAVVLGGCTDKIVYKDLPDFVTPPAGAGGFLGYSNTVTKQTTCGNCHISKQGVWVNTAHARAWDGLQSSSHAAESCEVCHSVTENGNLSTDAGAGYTSTKNERYEDVQCESCHGPGLTHVTSPGRNNLPLASMAVGTTLESGCGECHSGTHQPFVEEWEASRHGKAVGSRNREGCWECHEGKHAIEAWGINSTYMETGDTARATALPVVCTVCHDPHFAKNPKQMRFPIDVPNLETNLCMKCHYRRAVPTPLDTHGPHSPQGPMLLGEAGWTPPNFQYPPGTLVGTHGSASNPRLCAGCHVNAYTAGDFNATGHSFQPIPCVDGSGVPTGATDCTDTERSFVTCTLGCHTHSESGARLARATSRSRMDFLAGQIEALLPLIPSSEFSTTDNRVSTGEGSLFNAQLARQDGSAIHNPLYMESLLISSLNQIKTDYGLPAGPIVVLRPTMTPPPSLKALFDKAK